MPDRPRAVIVITGSELVRGERRDANGPYLAAELVRAGFDPARILVVGDRPDDLEAALREGLAVDLCVTSGGLGPTHDDRTVELLAKVMSRPLELRSDLELEIGKVSRGYAERLGRPYADFVAGVRKQALVPAGGEVLGLAGTAPGLLLDLGGRIVVVLPGPPGELQRLWERAAAHESLARLLEAARPRTHRLLRFFGPSESSVALVLDEAGGEREGLEITVCAHDYEIHVDLLVERGAEALGEAAEALLRRRFGAELFAEDPRPVAEIVLALARDRGLTVATAESCTGGLVASRLTAVPGASDVFLGGVVAYGNEAKRSRLGVPDEVIRRHGAVSAECAAAMAQGALTAFGTGVAVSVTGVAGPDGGTPEKPVGLVFVHVEAGDGSREAVRLDLPGDRDRIRGRATATSLHALRRLLARPVADPRT